MTEEDYGTIFITTSPTDSGYATNIGGSWGHRRYTDDDEHDDGACKIHTYADVSVDLVDAGVITVSGGSPDVIAVEHLANGYYSTNLSGVPFMSGASVTIAGSGADAPEFSEALVFPPYIAGPITNSAVSLDDGYTMTWSPLDARVVISLSQDGGGLSRVVDCTYDGMSGSATIPSSALDTYGRGTVRMIISADSVVKNQVGIYPTRLVATYWRETFVLPIE